MFSPDNVQWEPETGELFIAGHPSALSYLASLPNHLLHRFHDQYPAQSIVARMHNVSDENVFLGRPFAIQNVLVDDGTKVPMRGSSVAVVDRKRGVMIVGMLFTDAIAVCDWMAISVNQK
jgi:hypothetical protein